MKTLTIVLLSTLLVGCYSPPSPRAREAGPSPPREAVEAPDERARLLEQPTLSEDEFLRLVELGNPTIQAALQDVDAASGRRRQAGLLPNPVLLANLEEAPASSDRLGEGKFTAGLAWPIPVGGRIGAASHSAETEKRAWEAAALTTRLEALRDARQALYACFYARQLAGLEEEVRALTAEFAETVRKRRAEKTVLELEVMKTSVELAAREDAVRTAQKESVSADLKVRGIVGSLDFDPTRVAVHPVEGYVLRPLAEYETLARGRHPSLAAADRLVEAAEAQVGLARRSTIPDVTIAALYGQSPVDAEEPGEELVELGIEVPLPLFDRNQGRAAEAEALRRKALLARRAAEVTLVSRVREAYRDVELRLSRAQAHRDTILPSAQKAVEQSMSLYKEGKVLNLEVLDAQRVLAGARRQYLEAQRDAAVGIVELQSLIGEER